MTTDGYEDHARFKPVVAEGILWSWVVDITREFLTLDFPKQGIAGLVILVSLVLFQS